MQVSYKSGQKSKQYYTIEEVKYNPTIMDGVLYCVSDATLEG